MTAVVLCGDAHTAPDRVVGPFATLDQAQAWASKQPGQPARYAAVMDLTPPENTTADNTTADNATAD
jgi:hypothetical protein